MGFTPVFRHVPKDALEWAKWLRSVRRSDGDIVDGELRDSAALSVIGRAQGTAGTPGDITAGSDNVFLRTRGGALGFGSILDADIPSTIARDTEVTSAITAHEAASDPHPGYVLSTELTALNLASGVYTPTLTNVTNVAASTAYECQYLRVGATVHVTGRADIDPTAAAATELGISLPVATNASSTSDIAGCAFCTAVQQGAGIMADTTNDRASLQLLANDTSNRAFFFSFSYQVIA